MIAEKQTVTVNVFDHETPETITASVGQGYVLHFCPHREESKSLAPDGSACDARTRGVLQRASIVAGQQWYVGKETDRRWECGEDLALLRASKAMVYRPGMTVPDSALRQRVAAEGMRELMRKSGLSQHTIEAIRKGLPVRHMTLQRIIAVLGEEASQSRAQHDKHHANHCF